MYFLLWSSHWMRKITPRTKNYFLCWFEFFTMDRTSFCTFPVTFFSTNMSEIPNSWLLWIELSAVWWQKKVFLKHDWEHTSLHCTVWGSGKAWLPQSSILMKAEKCNWKVLALALHSYFCRVKFDSEMAPAWESTPSESKWLIFRVTLTQIKLNLHWCHSIPNQSNSEIRVTWLGMELTPSWRHSESNLTLQK